MTKLLFATSEALPFSKTGGLADVTAALPKALAALGHEVAVVLPMYLKNAQNDRAKLTKEVTFSFRHGIFENVATVYSTKVEGVTYYLIEHQPYFERDGFYGYGDDGERFAFFQIAILEMLTPLGFVPEIIHVNDWQTAMIPTLLKNRYQKHPSLPKIKTVLTIHNLAFQGNFPANVLVDCFGLSEQLYFGNLLCFHDGISFLKAGIVDSDFITTVSKTYSYEILSDTYGENMQWILKSYENKLTGILNGIDTTEWNPAQDKFLSAPLLTSKDKVNHKLALQKSCHFRQDKSTLLVGMVTRLSHQKGLSLLIERIQDLMNQDIQLVVLGSGEPWMEQALYDLQYRFPRRFYFYRGYNEAFAHQIYAGIDLFLMPSLFEPCGISQMISMRYQGLVFARKTGGLQDTVLDYNDFTKQGYGFTFQHFDGNDFVFHFKRAVDTYYDNPERWNKMVRNLKKLDFSFDKSAKEYAKLYQKVLTA